MFRLVVWSEKNKINKKNILELECYKKILKSKQTKKSVPQSYIYGSLGTSPYLGATTAAAQNATGLTMQIPSATQLSHAAALAAATSQFYEYQVSPSFFIFLFMDDGIFLGFFFFDFFLSI